MSWMREIGLQYNPFDRAIKSGDDVFESRDLVRLQDAITAAVHQRSMLVVIGPPGSGKTTTTINMLFAGPSVEGKKLLVIRDIVTRIEDLDVGQIEYKLLEQIKLATGDTTSIRSSAVARTTQLQRMLGDFSREHEVVLVLEDGHKMRKQTLINLKRLRELRFAMRERLLTVIVLAQPAMRTVLEDLPEVFMRSEVLEMQGLSAEEVGKYLNFKLVPAGKSATDLFTADALKAIRTGLHWPLRINHHMTRMLQEAVELGEVPVPLSLVEKYVTHENSLHSLFLLSGMDLTEVQRELAKAGQRPQRNTLKLVIEGRTPNSPLVGPVREVLVGRAGPMAALYSSVAAGLTTEERKLLEEIGEGMAELNYNFARVARECKLDEKRVYDLMHAEDVTLNDLKRVQRAIGTLLRRAA